MKLDKLSSSNLFVLITFSISIVLALAYYLLFPEKDQVSYSVLAILYMFMPTIGTIVVHRIIKKRSWKSLAINFNPNWWFLFALLIPIILAYLSLAVNLLWPGVNYSPEMEGFYAKLAEQSPEKAEATRIQLESLKIPKWILFIGQAIFAGLTINAVAGFGEELGWRGFLVREYKNLTFWNAALRIGIIWGLWHAPFILMGHNYPSYPELGVGMMVIWCILLSPLFLYIRIKTHSTIAAAIAHGVLNGGAGIPLLFIVGGNEINSGITGFSGWIALLIIILLVVVYDLKISKKPITNRTILEAIKQ